MNLVRVLHYPFADIRSVDSVDRFHEYLYTHAIGRYAARTGGSSLGSVLAVCAHFRDARYLKRFPFENLVITGTGDRREEVREATQGDARISYQPENCESLTFPARSFDLVFCKEGLHHLARPVLGVYEMLRVCRRAVVMIEPYESLLERALQRGGVATTWERKNSSFLSMRSDGTYLTRDNHVYHWSRRQLESLLNSLYLDSGYSMEIHVGWLTKRVARWPKVLREMAAAGSAIATHIPGFRGNLATIVILPGANIPPSPAPFR